VYGAYSAYSAYKLEEDERKAKILEDRQKAELKIALEGTTKIPFSFLEHIKANPKPTDYVATGFDIGTGIENSCKIWMGRVLAVFIAILAYSAYRWVLDLLRFLQPSRDQSFLGYMYERVGFNDERVAKTYTVAELCGYVAASILALYMIGSDCGDFDLETHLYNCLDLKVVDLFLQRKNKSEASWLRRACTWIVGSSVSSYNIDYKVHESKKWFGRIVALSLPLAASPRIARKYYWVGILGHWHAMTIYHYGKHIIKE